MRAAVGALVALAPLVLSSMGCGHAPLQPVSSTEIELAHDEARAGVRLDKPLVPPRAFEELVRFDPKLPSWTPLRLRLRLAQPGAIVLTVYRDAGGRPGQPVRAIDRRYGAELVGGATDGRWLVERLDGMAAERGPIWVGLYSPEKDGDVRLWATPNGSGEVFQREADGALSPVPRTPILRVDVAP